MASEDDEDDDGSFAIIPNQPTIISCSGAKSNVDEGGNNVNAGRNKSAQRTAIVDSLVSSTPAVL